MKTDKELYPVFELDVCTMSYAMHTILVGAKDENDVIKHLPEILKNAGKDPIEMKMIIENYTIGSDCYKPVLIPNVYTDTLYEKLSGFWYAE